MSPIRILISFVLFVLSQTICIAQVKDSLQIIKAFICDENNKPISYTYIKNLGTGYGIICDTSGIFSFEANESDSLLFSHLAYEDKILIVSNIKISDTIYLKIRNYKLNEVRIFEWGSSYADFRAKMMSMKGGEDLGKRLGLPQQTGNPISDFKNPEVIRNPVFAYTNPIDFLYFNLNKKQKSIQKVVELEKNEESIRKFESIYNRQRISVLTKLEDAELDTFMIYLNLNFQCDFTCSEIQIVSEIFRHWRKFSEEIKQ